MILDLVVELRRRLGVGAEVDDAQLGHVLHVATDNLAPWLVDDPTMWQASVDEATVQLAVMVFDTQTRGMVGVDVDGDYTLPAARATPGMVRGVFGVLGPALRWGGSVIA